MTGYYEQWEKDFARAYRFRLPIIMEEDGLPERTTVTGLILVASIARGIRKMCAGASTKKAVMPMSI